MSMVIIGIGDWRVCPTLNEKVSDERKQSFLYMVFWQTSLHIKRGETQHHTPLYYPPF